MAKSPTFISLSARLSIRQPYFVASAKGSNPRLYNLTLHIPWVVPRATCRPFASCTCPKLQDSSNAAHAYCLVHLPKRLRFTPLSRGSCPVSHALMAYVTMFNASISRAGMFHASMRLDPLVLNVNVSHPYAPHLKVP